MSCDTLEIRWFLAGPLPDSALTLAREATNAEPPRETPRTDHYLRLPHSPNIGIKLRDGRVEHKWLLDSAEGLKDEPRAETFGYWRKIGFPADVTQAEWMGNDWRPVEKRRRVSPWTLENGEARALEAHVHRPTRCDVELSSLRAAKLDFWSLCLEAEGPSREALLRAVLARYLERGLADLLGSARPTDFPAWLRQLEP